MKSLLATVATLTAFGAGTVIAAPATYNFDPDHSQVVFDYTHMGFSTSTGLINGLTGTIVLDDEDPSASTVEATIPMAGFVSVSPKLDEHLASGDFFNGALDGMEATFKSTSVEADGDNEAKVTGDLTLNGVTKEVVLDVDLNQKGQHPMSGKEVVGFDAETTIKRSDFNLGMAAPAVSDEVEIVISVEAGAAE